MYQAYKFPHHTKYIESGRDLPSHYFKASLKSETIVKRDSKVLKVIDLFNQLRFVPERQSDSCGKSGSKHKLPLRRSIIDHQVFV